MITRETILDLIEKAQNNSISIYLPTHQKGEEVQQDPIRLKNMLREIEQELIDSGMKQRETDRLLEEPRKLLEQPLFWQHNDRGLALFVAEDFFEFYRIPLKVEARYMIDEHFLITPLLPMITLDGTFCILVISRKNSKLLKCTRESVEELSLGDAPTSMKEFQQFNEYEKSLSTARGGGSIHGWGDVEFDQKEVEYFLKALENEVTSILKKRNDPLIVGGIDQAVAIYRKVNHYHRLMDTDIKGNPDPKSDEEIRDEGWEIIKSYFLQQMYSDMKRFGDLSGSDKQSDDLNTIVEGAYYGKVDALFIPIGEQRWGWFDEEQDLVHHGNGQSNGEHDLLNIAAIKTITQGGEVYAMKREEMPDGSPIAAIFRYS